jgi:hypothetical protein
MSTTPTLADDSFVDKAIAHASIALWDSHDGAITNAMQLLARPVDVRGDESGAHPGERFVMITITREEVRAMLKALDDDWADHVKATCGTPSKSCNLENGKGQCCCNCRYHIEDFHHCRTYKDKGPITQCVCSMHKGWICMPPESSGASSDWAEHGRCEMHAPKVEAKTKAKP